MKKNACLKRRFINARLNIFNKKNADKIEVEDFYDVVILGGGIKIKKITRSNGVPDYRRSETPITQYSNTPFEENKKQ